MVLEDFFGQGGMGGWEDESKNKTNLSRSWSWGWSWGWAWQQEILETKKSLWKLRGKEKKQYPRKPEEVSELKKTRKHGWST